MSLLKETKKRFVPPRTFLAVEITPKFRTLMGQIPLLTHKPSFADATWKERVGRIALITGFVKVLHSVCGVV